MPNRGRGKLGRGGVPRAVPNISQRPRGSTSSRTPTPLPSQYNFTPSSQPRVTEMPQTEVPIYSPQPHFRDFPPPMELFHDSPSQQREIGNSSSLLQNQNSLSPPLQPSPASTNHHSQAQSNQSSAAHNFHGEEEDGVSLREPVLQEHLERLLNSLLLVPGREQFTTVLSPQVKPNTTWYDSLKPLLCGTHLSYKC